MSSTTTSRRPLALGIGTVVPGDGTAIDQGTFVGYRVREELRGIGDTTTGPTPAVTGELVIEGTGITSVSIEADLTLHGVTRQVEWELDAQLVGNTIVIVGQLPVAMSDFDLTPPKAGPVLEIADDGVAEVQPRFTKA